MSARTIRRAEERKARKLARKAGVVDQNPAPTSAAESEGPIAQQPEPPSATDERKPPSDAQRAANKANAAHSTGPTSEAGREASSQNHTVHGLARHNGAFKLLLSEDRADFEALKKSLASEHQATTETEIILINRMAESHWLAARAQKLQDTCIDLETGAIKDQALSSLYFRYYTSHNRAFHKSLNDLIKLRSEARKDKEEERKTQIGFEAQKMQKQKLEMKKTAHDLDMFRKDVENMLEYGKFTASMMQAERENPGFEARFDAEMAKRKAA